MLGNGPHGLGNGPLVLGNGPHLLGIMSHSALCRIRGYVVRHYVAFVVMSLGIMSHSALCHIRTYVVLLYVVRRNVARPNVVRPSVYQLEPYTVKPCGCLSVSRKLKGHPGSWCPGRSRQVPRLTNQSIRGAIQAIACMN